MMICTASKPRATTPRVLAAAALLAALSACAGTRPAAYSELASSGQLRPAERGQSDKVAYLYKTDVNWRRYYKAIIDPVQIYDGADAQFGKLPPQGQDELADYMEAQFREKIGGAFEIVDAPDRSTLRIHLTLTGAVLTKPVIGTFSRFDLAGGPYNAFQGIRGKEGALTGSVFYAVEIYDGASNRLLSARIIKQYPAAMNMKATFGALTAAKTGIRKGAEDLTRQLTSAAPSDGMTQTRRDRRAAQPDRDEAQMTREDWRHEEAAIDYPVCGNGRSDSCRQRAASTKR
jgi:hypothetical protein